MLKVQVYLAAVNVHEINPCAKDEFQSTRSLEFASLFFVKWHFLTHPSHTRTYMCLRIRKQIKTNRFTMKKRKKLWRQFYLQLTTVCLMQTDLLLKSESQFTLAQHSHFFFSVYS